jgi:polyhydroxyalkanoate synthesis regulator phasin
MVDGKPDWAEDCVCEYPGLVTDAYDAPEVSAEAGEPVYTEAPLYSHETVLSLQSEVARLTSRVTELETKLTVDSLETVKALQAERDRLAREVARLNNEMHGPAADGH